jgi:hypothetical protein
MVTPLDVTEGNSSAAHPATKSATDRSLTVPIWTYLRHSRLLVVLSSPFIYLCFFTFLLLDLSVSTYQATWNELTVGTVLMQTA